LYSTPVHIWFLAGKTVKAFATKAGFTNSAVATLTGVFSYPPLKTGQTNSYSTTGSDGDLQKGVARSYTDNGDGTVTDNATGLVWQKCSRGQNNDASCSGSATTATWTDAGSYCSSLSLAGKTWRLPSIQELETLPNYSQSNPAIDTTIFPSTKIAVYWSSTTSASNTSIAWGVNFSAGEVTAYNKVSTFYVRCVSGQSKDYSSNFNNNGDGTVTDKATGLVWQKCSRGQNNDASCTGTATASDWSTAVSYCGSLTLAGKTWRLPNINELKSIVDTTKTTAPAIDTTIFPSTVAFDSYWSSTTFASNTSTAWVVVSFDGQITNGNKTSNFYVRCVSGP
jgi:formylglycine-generating enzyme required for sulfatase activity